MKTFFALATSVLGVFAALATGCSNAPAVSPNPASSEPDALEVSRTVELEPQLPGEYPGLHNVFRLSERVVSGNEPAGEEAFRALAKMGIRTAVSVDGKRPDAELAAKFGIRYVHVPIGYNGIGGKRLLELVKTFRELPSPFYVHCYHGKHRGPTAAAVARVALDGVARAQAIAEMRRCGAAESYKGLYASVANLDVPAKSVTEALDFDFSAARKLDDFAEVMVSVSRRFENLKKAAVRRPAFAVDPRHPDVEPAHEALQLAELFTEAARTNNEVDQHPADFRKTLEQARDDAWALTRLLKKPLNADGEKQGRETVAALASACKSCHKSYRNVEDVK